MIFLGADPDLRVISLVGIAENGALASIYVADNKTTGSRSNILDGAFQEAYKLGYPDSCAYGFVEYPQARPNSPHYQKLVELSAVSGMIAAEFRLQFKLPYEWKGNLDKATHQCRSYMKMGWEYKKYKKHAVPIGDTFEHDTKRAEVIYNGESVDTLPQKLWSDIGDSLGLALEAKKQFEKIARRKEALRDTLEER